MATLVKLNHFDDAFPQNNSLINCQDYSQLVLSKVEIVGGAAGNILIHYHGATFKSHQIESLISIDLEVTAVGFNFIAPGLSAGQEIKFEYHLLF